MVRCSWVLHVFTGLDPVPVSTIVGQLAGCRRRLLGHPPHGAGRPQGPDLAAICRSRSTPPAHSLPPTPGRHAASDEPCSLPRGRRTTCGRRGCSRRDVRTGSRDRGGGVAGVVQWLSTFTSHPRRLSQWHLLCKRWRGSGHSLMAQQQRLAPGAGAKAGFAAVTGQAASSWPRVLQAGWAALRDAVESVSSLTHRIPCPPMVPYMLVVLDGYCALTNHQILTSRVGVSHVQSQVPSHLSGPFLSTPAEAKASLFTWCPQLQ